jgi:hypothetical protein
MRRCDEREADLIIDDPPYPLESFPEIKRAQHLHGRKGVRFVDFSRSWSRLEGEHKEALKQRRQGGDDA